MLVDLSVTLDERTPAYPGDPRIAIRQSADIAADGYVGHEVSLGTHTGTHIDAPAHMLQGGRTLGAFPLDQFTGHARLLEGLTMAAVENAQLQPGDIVLFNTGASQHYYEPGYFADYPVMPAAVADYLVHRSVKLVGLDTCSADIETGYPIHTRLLQAGIPIIENLTNLSSLRGKAFLIYAFPLSLDLDGSPVRVIAETTGADA